MAVPSSSAARPSADRRDRWLEVGSKLARAIIDLGDSFGLQVVAEGIEHEAQRRRLIELGCGFGQDYRFARPMPAPELSSLLGTQPAAARC